MSIFINVQLQVRPAMRKEENFTVYPVAPSDTTFLIQSDRRIGRVDLIAEKIFLSRGRSSGSYGPDLCVNRGADTYKLSTEQLNSLVVARDKMAGITTVTASGSRQLGGLI